MRSKFGRRRGIRVVGRGPRRQSLELGLYRRPRVVRDGVKLLGCEHIERPRSGKRDGDDLLDAAWPCGHHGDSIAEKDRLEGAGTELHVRARQFFLDLADRDPEHYLVLHARTGIESIAASVRDRVASLMSAQAGKLAP